MVVSMDRWKGKVVIVTGASAGIGAAVAAQLTFLGLKVVGLARRKEPLEELAQQLKQKDGNFYPLQADITKEDDIIKSFKWIKENLGPIHILVNNAGVVRNTTLMDGCTKDWKDVLDTNVLGLCIATREAVKDMKENNTDGHIIHINSILGHRVIEYPNINIYTASKFGVTALTETLRQELNSINSKIKITSISPGIVQTEIREVGGFRINPEIMEAFEEMPYLRSTDVADAVVYVLSTPLHVQVHELLMKPLGEIL